MNTTLIKIAIETLLADTERLVRRMLKKANAGRHDNRRCIMYSLISRDTFRALGFRSEVLPCIFMAANREAISGLGPDEGAYQVIIGDPLHPPEQIDGWNGHLVTVIEDRVFLDLSLGQANRPGRGIRISPMWGPYTPLPPTLDDPYPCFARLTLRIGESKECELQWYANPGNLGWEHAPDAIPSRRSRIVRKLTSKIQKQALMAKIPS
jgi:hypothetical protein